MKKRVLGIFLTLAMVFTFAFSMPVFAGTSNMKKIEITSNDYDLVTGVTMTWSGVKKAEKYYVYKNFEKVKTIKATKKNNTYTFSENDTVYDGDIYAVRASKAVKQKQYYNKKTKKWQLTNPGKKYLKKTRYKKLQKVFALSEALQIKLIAGENGGGMDTASYKDELHDELILMSVICEGNEKLLYSAEFYANRSSDKLQLLITAENAFRDMRNILSSSYGQKIFKSEYAKNSSVDYNSIYNSINQLYQKCSDSEDEYYRSGNFKYNLYDLSCDSYQLTGVLSSLAYSLK